MKFVIKTELPATDVTRAARWYREKLGLEPVLCGNEPIAPGTTEFDSELLYDTGSNIFGIYETWTAGRNEATAMRLVTDDFVGMHAELKANGVEFIDQDYGDEFRTIDGILTSPDGEMTAWMKDSEGNIIAIGSTT